MTMPTKPRRRLDGTTWRCLVVAPMWLGALACNQLLGIEEAELDTGASGGRSGTGGAQGGGSGGTGGGQPGGTCADYDAGDLELARGCLMRISCDPVGSYYSMTECMSYGYQLTNAYEACTYGAESCAEVEACLGRRAVTPASCQSVSGWTCDGDEAVLCGVAVPYAFDCVQNGATGCFMPAGFPDQGSTAPCLVDPEPCADPSGGFHCSGNVLYECIDGARYGVDCTAVAGTCVEAAPGRALCIDSTIPCSTPGAISCDGDVLEYCGETGLSAVLDCGTAGLRCETLGGNADCVAPTCTPDDVVSCSEGCDGTRLRFCLGGSPTELDCADFGFASCETADVNGFTRAFCAGELSRLQDSCAFALDGECDLPPLCDEGTDTTDCELYPPQ